MLDRSSRTRAGEPADAPARDAAAVDPATVRLLLGGSLSLAVVMGVGRFYYTPLLPLMQGEYGFGPQTAGLIAAANFAGYLLGSLAAGAVTGQRGRLLMFRSGLLASAGTTLGMGLSDTLAWWLALRFISGAASAFAMIGAAGIIAEALSRAGKESLLSWLFGGVGLGIALSGILVHFASPLLDASALWLTAGAVSAALAPFLLWEVRDRALAARATRLGRLRRVPRPLPFWPLLASYSLEGLGYSVFATFIVAIVKSRPGVAAIGDWVWVLVGLAGLPSCLLWAALAERIGFARSLALAYATQAVAVALPAVATSGPAALLAAVLFGGTFLAITVLTLPLGRHGAGGRGIALLTAGFGLGQMLGPLFAGQVVAGPSGYDAALLASAGSLALATVSVVVAIRARARQAR